MANFRTDNPHANMIGLAVSNPDINGETFDYAMQQVNSLTSAKDVGHVLCKAAENEQLAQLKQIETIVSIASRKLSPTDRSVVYDTLLTRNEISEEAVNYVALDATIRMRNESVGQQPLQHSVDKQLLRDIAQHPKIWDKTAEYVYTFASRLGNNDALKGELLSSLFVNKSEWAIKKLNEESTRSEIALLEGDAKSSYIKTKIAYIKAQTPKTTISR